MVVASESSNGVGDIDTVTSWSRGQFLPPSLTFASHEPSQPEAEAANLAGGQH